ncbi:MAG TPA: metallophosphoesterase [Solirubrobacteraceae bacterium]|jgi:Icc-related predicted phosphoesterase|nr:metallophosphoesterase [Solirubrobacteraceae bacterium]
MGSALNGAGKRCLRIAAAGDLHCSGEQHDQGAVAIAELGPDVDLVLLAGDLTTHGEPDQARYLAEGCAAAPFPVFAVLGNHDWHADRVPELVEVLESGGIRVLQRRSEICSVDGHEVGIVGAKGFVGGFAGSHLPDFGEPLLREVYAETSADVDAVDAGLRAVELCPTRIVLLHYAPTDLTVAGEPEGIWPYLGCDRLAAPIAEHEPDMVLHGHAHAGTFEGAIGNVPVYNVAIPVTGRDFWLFELDVSLPARLPIR